MKISESEAFAQLAISLIEYHGDITCDLAVEVMNKHFPDKTPEQIRAALDKLCEADAFASDGECYMVG